MTRAGNFAQFFNGEKLSELAWGSVIFAHLVLAALIASKSVQNQLPLKTPKSIGVKTITLHLPASQKFAQKGDAVQMKAYSTCYSTGEHFCLRDVETLGSSVQIDKNSVCLLFVSRVNGLNARLLFVSSEDNRSCKHCS